MLRNLFWRCVDWFDPILDVRHAIKYWADASALSRERKPWHRRFSRY